MTSRPFADLTGRVAVITGTASGQGRAAALAFARAGATIVGCDLDAAGDASTRDLVAALGGSMSSTAPLDLADEEAVEEWIGSIDRDHGRIDIFYANAAATRFSPFESTSRDEWHFVLRNELDVVFLPLKHAWRLLRRSGSGRVVLVGSTAGISGSTTNSRVAHTVTKGGIVALTKQLAAEGAPDGIRVNCVSPGMIATPATANDLLAPDHPMASIARAIPLKRVGTAEEVVACALFLCSDEAAYVTGANLVVDGGWSAVLPG
ncbi:dehydrogenase [Subtercola boreus]|uniref:Dehydrogenase n=1 Tax=Subtercola boreus TaxID=120213 RepID=A0A3E0VEI3_9MICO|nr:SDR family NAD(P)-dependent oxidoreductase [Subtercola boreus]RFA08151.1 dehydrogenase [Subtercola boreus]TQL54959.1 NAD(P)-dependent dehydrogenase (short-subunit alcohol dehydrogenase family) [Subtercola boreus]